MGGIGPGREKDRLQLFGAVERGRGFSPCQGELSLGGWGREETRASRSPLVSFLENLPLVPENDSLRTMDEDAVLDVVADAPREG